MKLIPKFLTISLVIAIYLIFLFGMMVMYFSVFGENLFLLILLIIGFGYLLEFISGRFPVESIVQVWKSAFQKTTVPMLIVCMIGALGLEYITSQSYTQVTVALFFLTLAALVLITIFYGFKNVFHASGFEIVEPKKSKKKEVI